MGFWDLMYGKKKGRSAYSKGLSAERKIRQRLENRGYIVRQSKGSREPYDLYALKGGRKLLVQVKSGTASASRKEIRGLRKAAKSKGAKALVMHVKGRKTKSKIVY